MPGNPTECRKRAMRCAELAVQAKNEPMKAKFVSLSKTWENLAVELERTEELMAAFQREAPPPVKPPAFAEVPNTQERLHHHLSPTIDPSRQPTFAGVTRSVR